MKITLATVKERLPAVVNRPACDTRFLALVNEAIQRLVMRPSAWYDMHYKYQITVTENTVTLPAEIASISSCARCCFPVPIHDMWFEFLESGFGLRGSCSTGDTTDGATCSGWNEALDRGLSPLWKDLSGSYPIKLYCDIAGDATADVIITGYDQDGNWVRTLESGSYIDGEIVNPSILGTLSTTTWSRIVNVVKPTTSGPVRMYEWHASDSSQSQIGVYQWYETVPMYRRFFIGGIFDGQTTNQINVIAKREFIPVQNDNDVLMIGSYPAIKAMAMAIDFEDKNDLVTAAAHEARAFRIMDEEAQHYLGPGMKVPMRIEGETWGAGNMGYTWWNLGM